MRPASRKATAIRVTTMTVMLLLSSMTTNMATVMAMRHQQHQRFSP
jgi:heme/copper-type cytochrome/quinol oxidase subunit 3